MKKRVLSLVLVLVLVMVFVPVFTPAAVAASEVWDDGVGVRQIAAGVEHTLFVKDDGTLWGCGRSYEGQLGLGDIGHTEEIVRIMDGVKKVSAGRYHTVVLKNDGSVWTFGKAEKGCLGDGLTGSTSSQGHIDPSGSIGIVITNEDVYRTVPNKVMDGVKDIAAGYSLSMFVKNDGSLWGCGANDYDALGPDGYKLEPVFITDNVKAVSANEYNVAAIKNDNSLWVWGENSEGQLGDGTYTNIITPQKAMDDVKEVFIGMEKLFVIKKDGTLWASGSNLIGSLGFGPTYGGIERINKFQQVAENVISGASNYGASSYYINDSNELFGTGGYLFDSGEFYDYFTKGMDDVRSISLGWNYALLIKIDGSVWARGVSSLPQYYGHLGLKTDGSRVDSYVFCMIKSPIPGDTPSSWARTDVTRAISLNLVPPSLQSQYTQATTRAEFCALAVALYEKQKGEITGRGKFDDTTDVNVEKAAYIGVVNGTSPGKFTPYATLTREQAATMLARLADAMGKYLPMLDIEPFADFESISPWAQNAARQVQAAGVMNGTSPGKFSPKGPYTREQSIVTMLRLYDVVK